MFLGDRSRAPVGRRECSESLFWGGRARVDGAPGPSREAPKRKNAGAGRNASARTKRMVETTYTPAEFLTTLADHIPDRYRHNIRYFGLLAPRVKGQTHDAVFALLGQERLGKPRRLRWAASMKKSFGVDPLMDREGQRMRWSRRLPPTPPR